MLNRREFLQALGGLTAGLMLPSAVLGQATAPAASPATSPATQPARDRWGPLLPQRRLGRTGVGVTMLGLGGWHTGAMNPRDAQATIELAIEDGVRFFDNAESYHAGKSERYYGQFLTPRFRNEVFITTKSVARDAKTARAHLQGSLDRLGVDHVDLWQIHAVESKGDVDGRIANGVLDVALEAQRDGKAKHVGFTGHSHPDAHRRMLEVLAEKGEPLRTCMMPINVVDPSHLSFVENVLPILTERNFGVIAMKTLSGGTFLGKPARRGDALPPRLVPDRFSLREAMHFVWSLPVSVVVSGPESPAQFHEMAGLARSFMGMEAAERRRLIDKAADAAGKAVEWYKAS